MIPTLPPASQPDQYRGQTCHPVQDPDPTRTQTFIRPWLSHLRRAPLVGRELHIRVCAADEVHPWHIPAATSDVMRLHGLELVTRNTMACQPESDATMMPLRGPAGQQKTSQQRRMRTRGCVFMRLQFKRCYSPHDTTAARVPRGVHDVWALILSVARKGRSIMTCSVASVHSGSCSHPAMPKQAKQDSHLKQICDATGRHRRALALDDSDLDDAHRDIVVRAFGTSG